MKSYGNLFPVICSLENLYEAARKARKRKTRHEAVERFELHRERYLRQLADELASGAWKPSRYVRFEIFDPKRRTISAAPYRDRVVHHALCNVLAPVLQRRFIADSFSCQEGKGTQAGRERCRVYTNRFPFALKCDVRKYFESIDHEILMAKLARVVRCEPTLRLCGLIVGSSVETSPPHHLFPGDDLLAMTRPRGLPIGNLTSQLLANFYLDALDHQIREALRAPGYVRYTDDFILWADDKDRLHGWRAEIAGMVETDRLVLHPVKTRVFPTHCGVPFLGFRFFPGRAPRLLGEVKRRFERRMRRCRREDGPTFPTMRTRQSAAGWKAFADYGNTKGLYRAYRRKGFG